MTRFARAKGSKASNEKKPEEATSWSEMKQGMLLKNFKPPEEKVVIKKKEENDNSNQTEWAPLGYSNADSFLGQSVNITNKKNKKLNKPESISKGGKINLKKKRKLTKKIESTGDETETNKTNCKNKIENKTIKKKKITEAENAESKETPKVMKKKVINLGKDKNLNEFNVNNSLNKEHKKRKLEGTHQIESEEGPVKKKKKKLKEVAEGFDENVEKKNKNSQNNFKKQKFDKNKKDKFGFNNKSKFGCKRNDFQDKKKYKDHQFNYDRSGVIEEIIVNGEKVPVVKFQGFPVTKEDAERLKKLRIDMRKEGIPKNKLEAALKLERRRAEKALQRLKKAVCFHCRGSGHLLSNCPVLAENQNTGTGICYKCGSTEHSAFECKVVKGTNFQYAECFICKEQGHIARQCPDNPRGLYPQGGACRECGDVTHLRKDCPKVVSQKTDTVVTVKVRNDRNLECLDEEIVTKEKEEPIKLFKKHSSVKF